MNRRRFVAVLSSAVAVYRAFLGKTSGDAPAQAGSASRAGQSPLYGMAVRVNRCIGCGGCMEACKIENDVPKEPFFFRTWVERYTVKTDQSVVTRCINIADARPQETVQERDILRSFFVPKLCNHCANPPCVQVCPVGATFSTKEGVVLIDGQRCIGCGYCIQACPYGARYLHPSWKTADKCTFCCHRLNKGLLPACVEVCPTQARIFGDLKSVASPLTRFRRMEKIHVLKPGLNTEPKVYYSSLDGEVR
jgi:Fe-S-cluster-containing dehydrogenase component